jgi:hypothetical protein
MNELSTLKFNLKELEQLEKQIYNRHLQFHFYSAQLADVHNQITNMILFVNEEAFKTIKQNNFYSKDVESLYIEKLTKQVSTDCIEYQNQITDLKDQRSKYILPHSILCSKINSVSTSLISYVSSIDSKIMDSLAKEIPKSDVSKFVQYPRMNNKFKFDPIQLRSPVTEQNFNRKSQKRSYSRFKLVNAKENEVQNTKGIFN